jgi:hypothetical protein
VAKGCQAEIIRLTVSCAGMENKIFEETNRAQTIEKKYEFTYRKNEQL